MKWSCATGTEVMEHLYYAGDNLRGLALLRERGDRVDLVYIDPPFATNTEFRMDSERANTVSGSGELAFADTLKGSEYLEQLRMRLEGIRSVMAEKGSIYVHIDLKMEHHVRLLMDEVFGARNFRNSITRIKCNPKNFSRYSYGNIKDTILFYSVSPTSLKWNPQEEPLSGDDAVSRYPLVDDKGRRYATTPLHAPGVTRKGVTGGMWRGMQPPAGRHWRYTPEKLDDLDAAGLIAWSSTGNPRKIIYADQSAGKLPQDVWVYQGPAASELSDAEERGYAGAHNPDIVGAGGHGAGLLRGQRRDAIGGGAAGPAVRGNGRRAGGVGGYSKAISGGRDRVADLGRRSQFQQCGNGRSCIFAPRSMRACNTQWHGREAVLKRTKADNAGIRRTEWWKLAFACC